MSRVFCVTTICLIALIACAASAPAAEHLVSDAEELAAAIEAVAPGDEIIMADGTWTDTVVSFETNGTPDAPVTLRAQTPGQVILTGSSCAAVRGDNLIISGLVFKDGSPPVSRETGSLIRHRSILSIGGSNNRVTDCAFVDYNSNEEGRVYHWVAIGGRENRVDHCYFRGQTDIGNTLMADVREGRPPASQIDHNHFAGRPPLGRNGGETIRIGLSSTSVYNGHCIVENNLFEDCDGEAEIISNKSCENTYRHNTFRHSSGHLTLRHGERNVVEGNFIFGDGKDGANGIRVINRDQRVFNNYIADTDSFGIRLQAGWPEAALNEYTPVERVTIAFNTIVNSSGSCLDVGGYGWDREQYGA
ncbi:MAG: polysaccharide lyase 6 family protein, partial [Armatimonadota bacterium]